MQLTPAPLSAAAPLESNTSAQHRKLEKAAGEFEACFAKELLRPMQEDSDSGDDASDAAGSLRSYATEALATAIGTHGGLGLAHAVLQQLDGNSAAVESRHSSAVQSQRRSYSQMSSAPITGRSSARM